MISVASDLNQHYINEFKMYTNMLDTPLINVQALQNKKDGAALEN
jgi:hypothetical protein